MDIKIKLFLATGKSMSYQTMFFKFFAVLLTSLLLSVSGPAFAQENKAVPLATDLNPLLDRAKELGLNVIIVGPEQEDDAVEDTGPTFTEQALKVRTELRRIFSKASELPYAILKTINKVSPDGTYWWLAIAVGITLVAIALGTAPAIYMRRFFREFFENQFNPNPRNRAEKISYLMFRAGMFLFNFSIMAIIATIILIVADQGHGASRATISVIIGGYFFYRISRHVFFFNILAPDIPSHRVVNLEDKNAEQMQVDWRRVLAILTVINCFYVWLAFIGLPGDPLKLLVMVSLLLSGLIVSYTAYKHKDDFKGIILGEGDPTNKPIWRRMLATWWHVIFIGYIIVSYFVTVFRIVLNQPSPLSLVSAPFIALIGGIVLYSILIIIIDRFYIARQKRYEEKVQIALEEARVRREQDAEELLKAEENAPEDDEELIINRVMAERDIETMPAFRPVFKPLLEQSAGILILIGCIGFILGTWDVNIGEQGNPVTAFLDTLMIVFWGWFMFKGVALYIDSQIEEESPDTEEEESEGEMGGQGASRLATLLPLVRNVLLASIVILSIMIVLSNMGLDIAPLFAGAGVIGLAVGFGAQTLIRDIFSGGFFLFDDAFRKGEYIELGNIRGTVEKISLRSFQLRHHNGPLHTIPFGEITQLTNYSRDWVMMKLPLRLTYDTDVERVRKLVKKLGQRLLDHPDIGKNFLQPLKSQGVYKMEDSAMIIRVKFMTKPGDQFVARKVVYQEIRDLFENEGIRFASKEVTVRLADEPKRELSNNDKQVIAASAARTALDDEEAEAGPQKEDDGP